MSLSIEEKNRYARNLAVPGVGEEGQEKLKKAKILIIGAGGLGSPAALYLAAAGVGTIGIADNDAVDISNLQRQILHSTERLGLPKTESAGITLKALNPDINIVPHHILVTPGNIGELISGYDFVLECTDNFESKFMINDACVLAGKPFCHASVIRFYGQIMTWLPGHGGCYRCLNKKAPAPGSVMTAREAGIIGATAGTLGCMQALEAIKYILGTGELLCGTMLTMDLLDTEFIPVKFDPDPKCPVCSVRNGSCSDPPAN